MEWHQRVFAIWSGHFQLLGDVLVYMVRHCTQTLLAHRTISQPKWSVATSRHSMARWLQFRHRKKVVGGIQWRKECPDQHFNHFQSDTTSMNCNLCERLGQWGRIWLQELWRFWASQQEFGWNAAHGHAEDWILSTSWRASSPLCGCIWKGHNLHSWYRHLRTSWSTSISYAQAVHFVSLKS